MWNRLKEGGDAAASMRRLTTTKGVFLLLLLAGGGILTYHYSYNSKYLTDLQDSTFRIMHQGLSWRRGATNEKGWWQEVVCKRGQHKRPEGDETPPLRRLFRDVMPERNRNVFLMDTACNPTPKFRAWCSVESWAKQNPEREVWFLLTAGRTEGNAELISKLLHQYTNLQLVTADLDDMFRHTPLLPLFNEREWTKTWPVELMSDMLRVLVLWWWGGVYSDTDVLSIRPLTLADNALGFEHSQQLGSAFYSFQSRHPVLHRLMKDMYCNFKPHQWGSIGPRAITRTMEDICGKQVEILIRRAPVTCRGNVTLYPQSTFYPLRYNEFAYYFDRGNGKRFNETFSRAYALHFWNKMSKNKPVKVNDNSVYEVAAKRFCPITYIFATAESDVF